VRDSHRRRAAHVAAGHRDTTLTEDAQTLTWTFLTQVLPTICVVLVFSVARWPAVNTYFSACSIAALNSGASGFTALG
jgi:hypothetical protein